MSDQPDPSPNFYMTRGKVLTDEEVEAAIGILERAGLLIVRRDETGHVRWFTLRTGAYGDDELRKSDD